MWAGGGGGRGGQGICIKVGSDESHFNVSLIVRDKVTRRQCPQTTTFMKRKGSRSGIEPRPYRLPALHLTARPMRLTMSGRSPEDEKNSPWARYRNPPPSTHPPGEFFETMIFR